MYITITLKINNCKFDIKIDNRQKVFAVLEILKQRRLVLLDTFPFFYKSYQKEKIISAYSTFEESEIHSGDIIEAIIK